MPNKRQDLIKDARALVESGFDSKVFIANQYGCEVSAGSSGAVLFSLAGAVHHASTFKRLSGDLPRALDLIRSAIVEIDEDALNVIVWEKTANRASALRALDIAYQFAGAGFPVNSQFGTSTKDKAIREEAKGSIL